jgi:hypothetical protein
MRGQKREHAALGHQMPYQSLRVQKLPIHPFPTLHRNYSPSSATIRSPDTPLFSALLEL